VPSYRAVLCLVQRSACADAPRPCELVPAHANAGGKLLLGHRDRWRESVLELPLERLTDRTIVDPEALRDDCAAAVRRGLGLERGEYRAELQSVAAPVRDVAGEVVAAVALTGRNGIIDRGDAVADAAAEVEARLAEAA